MADITTEEGRAHIIESLPHVDIMVTNNGGAVTGNFRDYGREEWDKVINDLMMTPIAFIAAYLDGMVEQSSAGSLI